MRKKITSIIAIAALVVTMMPAMVFGATEVNTEAALGAAIADGAEIELSGSVKLYSTIEINNIDVTIDLKGQTLYSENTDLFKVSNGGKLTIKDTVGGGVIYTSEENCNVVWSVGDGTNANVIVFDGNFRATANTHAVIYHNGTNYGADVTINGTYVNSNDVAIFLSGQSSFGENRNKLTINNATIKSRVTCVEVKWGDVIVNNSEIALHEYTGTPSMSDTANGSCSDGYAIVITNNSTATASDISTGTVTINSGNVVGAVGIKNEATEESPTNDNAEIVINGGTFDTDVSDYVPGNTEVEKNEDGSWSVGGSDATEEDSDNTGSTTTEGIIAEGTTTADTNAQTGDNTNLVFPAALVVLALGAMVAAKRRFN